MDGGLIDLIGIGTSPLMLIHALHAAQDGARVVLIDAAPGVGGAWRTVDLFGYRNLEPAVHLLENRPGIAQVLEAASGIAVPADTAGLNFGLWRGRPIAMGPARVMLHGLVGLRAALHGNGEKAARMAISARRAMGNLQTPFVYPQGGMGRVITAMARRLTDGGGTILLGQPVESIAVSNPHVTVTLSDRSLACRRLVFSSRGHAPILPLPGGTPPQMTTDRIRNAVLQFTGEWMRPTGYVEVFGDPMVKRLRNTGSIASLDPNATFATAPAQVASVQLRSGKAGLDENLTGSDLARALLDRLIHLRLIRPGAEPIDAQVFMNIMTTADRHACEALQNTYPDQLQFIQSTDFAEALVNRPEGSNALISRPCDGIESGLDVLPVQPR
jgi:hypothetical protein